jgi:hypothetical protein
MTPHLWRCVDLLTIATITAVLLFAEAGVL